MTTIFGQKTEIVNDPLNVDIPGISVATLKGDTGATGAIGATGATGAGVVTGGTTGQLLSKKTNADYDTEWVTSPFTMIYPGAGIALSTGSAWSASITDNSANWNTAYGWGNHASGGYVKTDQTVAQTIGDTTNRLLKLWATDITCTNTITGGVSGNAGTVTNATFTTALTVNTGTLTLTANSANTSVLTIGAGSVSVSGSNSGDVTLATDHGLGLTGQLLSMGTPSTLTASTTNAVTTTTHTHAITGFLTSLSGAVLIDQTVGQTIGDTANRLTKLWVTDITCTNAITGSITGNAGTVTNGVYTTGSGTVFEVPLTFGNGLTRTVNAVANNLITGLAGGQTVIGGTLTAQDLTLRSNAADTSTGSIKIITETACTDEKTGALVVSGGFGLNGAMYIKNILTVDDSYYLKTPNVTMKSGLSMYIKNPSNVNVADFSYLDGSLSVYGTGTSPSFARMRINTWDTQDNYIQNNITNLSTGSSASSDWIATSDSGSDSTNFIDLGINGSGWSSVGWTINGANDGYLYTASTNLAMGTATASKVVSIFTGGTLAANERIRITDTGTRYGASGAPSYLHDFPITNSASTDCMVVGNTTALIGVPVAGDTVHAQRVVSSGNARGFVSGAEGSHTVNTSNAMQGLNAFASTAVAATANYSSSSGGLRNNYGVYHRGSGIVTEARTVNGIISVGTTAANNASTITYATVFNAQNPVFASYSGTPYGVITNLYQFRAQGGAITSATLTNRYGLYIEDLVAGTNRYGIYQVGSSDKNYLAGQLGLGIASTSVLTLKAGSETASTAPLKFTSGSLLTSAEAGAIEFLTDKYYATITTGTTRKEIQLYDTYYGEMYMYDNATACVIDTANVYHAVYNTFGNNDGTLAPTTSTAAFTFKAGAGYAITAVADGGSGTIDCTTAGHSLLAGEPITITGTTNYNGVYLVLATGLTATNFKVTKAYVSSQTGSARLPATLKCLEAGVYAANFTVSGVAVTQNDVMKFELNKDATPLDSISARDLWDSGTNYTSSTGSGNVTLTAGQYVWLSVKNYSGTGDLTINCANVNLHRI